MFAESYKAAEPHLRRFRRIQAAYESSIIPETWATLSEIFLPVLRTAVEQALPPVMDYLFPPSAPIFELVPKEPVDSETVRKVENWLNYVLLRQMKIRKYGLLTLKDAIKAGCGYGMVEAKVVTPPERKALISTFAGVPMSAEPVMGIGQPRLVETYKYVPFETVIPTPDGDEPDDVTMVFVLTFVREDELRSMYLFDSTLPRENRVLMEDPETIIKTVKGGRLDAAVYPLWWVMKSIAGEYSFLNRMASFVKNIHGSDMPARIPILKCYAPNEHIWLAAGKYIIYHQKSKYETMSCPLVKATACPDSGNWYSHSDVSASESVADGLNTVHNAILDMLTYYLHPTVIVNRNLLANAGQDITRDPYKVIEVSGSPENVIRYEPPPPFPAGAYDAYLTMLDSLHSSVGQPRQLQGQGVAGVIRGGVAAFESFLMSATGRQKLMGLILEMGWLEKLITQTLITSQLITGSTEEREFMIRGDDGGWVSSKVTGDDLYHSMDVFINTRAKMRSSMDVQLNLLKYAQFRNNPFIRQDVAIELLENDPEFRQKLIASDDEVRRNVEIMRAASMKSTDQAEATSGGAVPPE